MLLMKPMTVKEVVFTTTLGVVMQIVKTAPIQTLVMNSITAQQMEQNPLCTLVLKKSQNPLSITLLIPPMNKTTAPEKLSLLITTHSNAKFKDQHMDISLVQ